MKFKRGIHFIRQAGSQEDVIDMFNKRLFRDCRDELKIEIEHRLNKDNAAAWDYGHTGVFYKSNSYLHLLMLHLKIQMNQFVTNLRLYHLKN